ncbi:hypothetical protein [Nitrospira calida]
MESSWPGSEPGQPTWSRMGCACWRPRSEAWGRRMLALWRSRCIHAAFWKGWWTGAAVIGLLAASGAVQFYLAVLRGR